MNKILQEIKKALALCKNYGCKNKRRNGSAYCQECSDKYHAEHETRNNK